MGIEAFDFCGLLYGILPPTRMSTEPTVLAEHIRLHEEARKTNPKNWKRWGPFLSERQWGTVREDYSPNGDCWNYLTHDQARSRAYRWGEDGILGICDRECRLCFSVAMWNGLDPIIKPRMQTVDQYWYDVDATSDMPLPATATLTAGINVDTAPAWVTCPAEAAAAANTP